MWNWNRKPIVPLHLVATIFIAIGVSVALLGFVLSEVFLPVGLVLFAVGISILFSRLLDNKS